MGGLVFFNENYKTFYYDSAACIYSRIIVGHVPTHRGTVYDVLII